MQPERFNLAEKYLETELDNDHLDGYAACRVMVQTQQRIQILNERMMTNVKVSSVKLIRKSRRRNEFSECNRQEQHPATRHLRNKVNCVTDDITSDDEVTAGENEVNYVTDDITFDDEVTANGNEVNYVTDEQKSNGMGLRCKLDSALFSFDNGH